MLSRWAPGLLLVLVSAGCRCGPPGDSDAGRDAGSPDGGETADAGQDAGVEDAGLPDAGTDAGLPDAGPGADGGQTFCDAYLTATCDWFARCGRLDPAQRPDCLALNRWLCSQEQVDAVLDAGKVNYLEAQLPFCLLGLIASDCARGFPGSSACDGLFTPATNIGGDCTRQWSTFCVNSYCGGSTCPAQCGAYLALDAGCSPDEGDACGPTAFCDFGTPRRCVAYLPSGATCTANDRCLTGPCDTVQGRCVDSESQAADAGCGSDLVCASGLYCKAGGCAPREVQGGPCRIYGGLDCASTFTCRITDGGTAGTCQLRSPLDGGCWGLPGNCDDGLLCDNPALLAPGRCVFYGSEGAACDRSLQNCKVGLLCDAVTLTCRRLPRVGETCGRDPGNFVSSDCADGFCPTGDGGQRCLAPQSADAGCDRPWECASTSCEQNVCAALCTTF